MRLAGTDLDESIQMNTQMEKALLAVDQEITGGAFRNIIEGNFRVRDIGLTTAGPRLPDPEEAPEELLQPPADPMMNNYQRQNNADQACCFN